MPIEASLKSDVLAADAVRIDDDRISVGVVLQRFHRRGYLKSVLQKAAEDTIIATHSQLLGLLPTDAQLQQAADQFRRRSGLLSVQETQKWLAARHLSEVDFEEIILQQMRYAFVFSRVTETARQSFQSTPSLWDRWTYQELYVPSESLAHELKCQHLEEGVSFADLAHRHEAVRSPNEGSGACSCLRAMLPQWLIAFADGATSGSVIGPLICPSGWALILVETVMPAVFDAETEAAIRKHLFQNWLSARIRESKVTYPLLDLLSCSNDS